MQEYWSELPLPSPGDLPHPGIKPRSSALEADSLLSEPPAKPLLFFLFFSGSELVGFPGNWSFSATPYPRLTQKARLLQLPWLIEGRPPHVLGKPTVSAITAQTGPPLSLFEGPGSQRCWVCPGQECRPGGSTRAPPPGVLQLTDGLMWVCGPGEVRSSDFSNLRDLLICKSMRPNP